MYKNLDGVHIGTNEVKDKHGHRDQGNIEREAKQKNYEWDGDTDGDKDKDRDTKGNTTKK